MAFSNSDLDVSLYFDLTNSRLRIKDNSDYAGESIDPANIAGVYTLTDPNSNILHQNADFNNPDVEPDSSLYSGYETFTETDGVYTLIYSAYDSNTLTTYTKTFTFTYDEDDIPDVVISVESDVGLATISSTDETPFTASKVLNTRTHTLTYPASWGSTTTTSIVVDAISLTELYTGAYVTTISSTVTVTGTDNLIIDATITGTNAGNPHNVWDTDGFYAVRTALNTFYTRWTTAQTSNPKLAREYATTWNEINSNYGMYNSYKQNGDIENAGEYLNNIKDLIPSDIDTDIDPSVSVPVTQSIPGYASQWLSGSGVPAASLGRTVDFYFRTDSNGVYTKATGSWVLDSILGANAIMQFSVNGTTGWTTTYANGLNYIRFSGDGGVSWTVASKFIDGYVYYAYASDSAGTGFIATDDPSFTFNPVLEYIAVKKFQSAHTGDLIESDFTGLFTKYRDQGYAVSVNPGTILVPTDSDGNSEDYTNAISEILIYKGDVDVTSDFVIAKSTLSSADGSVTDSTLTVSSITADTGYIDVTCTKTGVDVMTMRIYVKKVKDGQAVIDITSIDNATIGINGSSKAYVKDGGINTLQINDDAVTTIKIEDDAVTGGKLSASVAGLGLVQAGDDSLEVNVDDSTIEIDTDVVQVKDGGINRAKVGIGTNIFLGYESGLDITTGNNNVYVGYQAGTNNIRGGENVFIGYRAGYTNTDGTDNVFIGQESGYAATDGGSNIFIGYSSGKLSVAVDYNVFIGTSAGYSNTTGVSNIFLGNEAGYYETGSNKLFIDNQSRSDEATSRTSSLVYGEFNSTVASQIFRINGDLEVPIQDITITLGGSGAAIGFCGATPIAQQDVTGAKGGNAALTSLLAKLELLGLISDQTT